MNTKYQNKEFFTNTDEFHIYEQDENKFEIINQSDITTKIIWTDKNYSNVIDFNS